MLPAGGPAPDKFRVPCVLMTADIRMIALGPFTAELWLLPDLPLSKVGIGI